MDGFKLCMTALTIIHNARKYDQMRNICNAFYVEIATIRFLQLYYFFILGLQCLILLYQTCLCQFLLIFLKVKQIIITYYTQKLFLNLRTIVSKITLKTSIDFVLFGVDTAQILKANLCIIDICVPYQLSWENPLVDYCCSAGDNHWDAALISHKFNILADRWGYIYFYETAYEIMKNVHRKQIFEGSQKGIRLMKEFDQRVKKKLNHKRTMECFNNIANRVNKDFTILNKLKTSVDPVQSISSRGNDKKIKGNFNSLQNHLHIMITFKSWQSYTKKVNNIKFYQIIKQLLQGCQSEDFDDNESDKRKTPKNFFSREIEERKILNVSLSEGSLEYYNLPEYFQHFHISAQQQDNVVVNKDAELQRFMILSPSLKFRQISSEIKKATILSQVSSRQQVKSKGSKKVTFSKIGSPEVEERFDSLLSLNTFNQDSGMRMLNIFSNPFSEKPFFPQNAQEQSQF